MTRSSICTYMAKYLTSRLCRKVNSVLYKKILKVVLQPDCQNLYSTLLLLSIMRNTSPVVTLLLLLTCAPVVCQ